MHAPARFQVQKFYSATLAHAMRHLAGGGVHSIEIRLPASASLHHQRDKLSKREISRKKSTKRDICRTGSLRSAITCSAELQAQTGENFRSQVWLSFLVSFSGTKSSLRLWLNLSERGLRSVPTQVGLASARAWTQWRRSVQDDAGAHCAGSVALPVDKRVWGRNGCQFLKLDGFVLPMHKTGRQKISRYRLAAVADLCGSCA